MPTRLSVVVSDLDGALARAGAPVCCRVVLPEAYVLAAAQGRLRVVEKRNGSVSRPGIAVQFEKVTEQKGAGRLWWLMPPGPAGRRTFALVEASEPADTTLRVSKDEASGQLDMSEGRRPVLRYNYQTVEPGALLAQIAEANRIYARARSNYIHPLYGPDGEELTKDWSLDHPHHRGIYWAWPEVQYKGQLGDLHALQIVFARPTGNITLRGGPVYAKIEAENLWKWQDKEPIVREVAIIRAYRSSESGGLLDLTFHLTALEDGVSLARRGTEHYGGLSIRLNAVTGQEIAFHTDPPDARPRMAWGTLSGTFAGGKQPLGVTVLQHWGNPDYPGDWIKYPQLNWFQPTFPAAKTRHALKKDKPLTLRFRLWIRPGGKAPDETCADQWRAFNGGSGSRITRL